MRITEPIKTQVDGLLFDILRADQAYALLREIGQHAGQINRCGFRPCFAPIQDALARDYLLAVAKLYDHPYPKYPTRSIRALVAAVKKSAGRLKGAKSPALRDRLARAGISVEELDDLPDSATTGRLIIWCQSRLALSNAVDSVNIWRAWNALKFRRDKVIAHNEILSSNPIPNLQWQQVADLLELAKKIVDLVSTAYLNLFLTSDDGLFFRSTDAERSTACLRRFLRNAGFPS
jgi:hypothetical protein